MSSSSPSVEKVKVAVRLRKLLRTEQEEPGNIREAWIVGGDGRSVTRKADGTKFEFGAPPRMLVRTARPPYT